MIGSIVVRCANCHTILENDIFKSDGKPCPKCGSIVRKVEISIIDKGTAHDQMRLKVKRPGNKRPIKEVVSGDNYQFLVKKWAKIERIIDRENDEYHEKVVDPETGEVYHECNEALSKHINHGSDKKTLK